MKLTEKEIAKECNVSITTVSRALNNKGRISKKTRDKILAYVEEKQTQIYTQNFCKKTIGLIVPNIQNEYYEFRKPVETVIISEEENTVDLNYEISKMYLFNRKYWNVFRAYYRYNNSFKNWLFK